MCACGAAVRSPQHAGASPWWDSQQQAGSPAIILRASRFIGQLLRWTYTRWLPLLGHCMRPRIGALGTARPSRAAAARVQVHTAAHLYRTTCKWLGRFQGLEPQRPLIVVSPARLPRSSLSRAPWAAEWRSSRSPRPVCKSPGCVGEGSGRRAGGWRRGARASSFPTKDALPCPPHLAARPAPRQGVLGLG